jgi:hypothetical protein
VKFYAGLVKALLIEALAAAVICLAVSVARAEDLSRYPGDCFEPPYLESEPAKCWALNCSPGHVWHGYPICARPPMQRSKLTRCPADFHLVDGSCVENAPPAWKPTPGVTYRPGPDLGCYASNQPGIVLPPWLCPK